MATDTIKLKDPDTETQQAEAVARRYRCDFVDLKSTKIDHELFRTVPVDLMFRYHFVPLQNNNGTLEIALADPKQIVLIDELAVLLSKKAKSQGCYAFADFRPAEKDRAIAARARRSDGRLHAGRSRR